MTIASHSAAEPSVLGFWTEGVRDLRAGIDRWRLAHLMGLGEIRRRYSRSRIGQFWLTLSTGISVLTMGLVWSNLWKMDLHDLMPFIAISLVTWTLITGTLGEATTVFSAAGPMFLNQQMSFSTAIYGLVYKNLIVLAHNLPIIAVTMLLFGVPLRVTSLLAVPGFLLIVFSLIWMSYLVAIVCVRYRDLIQVVQSILMVAFFITPVLWKPEQLGAGTLQFWLLLNPMADLMAVLREPLLGELPTGAQWLSALCFAVGGSLLTLPLIGMCRRRIIYWI